MLGVCLRYDQTNYGSKLQALATIRMFDKYGVKYEIIRYNKRTISFFLKSIPRFFNLVFLHDRYEEVQKKIVAKLYPEIKEKCDLRNQNFRKFDENFNDHLSQMYKSYSDLKKQCASRYSAVITCSDQLWSPSALGSGFYNLMFVPYNIYKCSWASSFGVKEIPHLQVAKTREYLLRIDDISVRESSGAEIVKGLTGKDVPVVMDPVFAYTKDEWDKLVPYKENVYGDYIFCYFLGVNQKHREVARTLSNKLGIPILTFRHMDRVIKADESFGDIVPYEVDPEDFLNILRNAKYVLTDSFHGASFSIIYEKKFVVFNRYIDESKNSKNTRIDSLCEMLQLQNRRYSQNEDILMLMDNPIEYSIVNERLDIRRRIMKDYLDKIMHNIQTVD